MENRTYYYARVSTKEQHLDRQIGMTALFILHHITDRKSQKKMDKSKRRFLIHIS